MTLLATQTMTFDTLGSEVWEEYCLGCGRLVKDGEEVVVDPTEVWDFLEEKKIVVCQYWHLNPCWNEAGLELHDNSIDG